MAKKLYDFSKYLDNMIVRIKKCDFLTNIEKDLILGNDAKQIRGIDTDLKAKRTSNARRLGVLGKLYTIRKNYLKKPLNEATNRMDIENFCSNVDATDLKERGKSDLKDVLKQFYIWYNKDIVPEYIAWMKGKILKDNRKIIEKTSEDLLTVDEQNKLLSACTNKRDYAIVKLLLESGMRPNEVLRLQIKHLNFNDSRFCLLTVPSDTKTGTRTIPLVLCVKALKDYLSLHQDKLNPEAYLWQTLKGKTELYDYNTFRMFCRRLKIKSGINKRFHPYIFRYSSYTNKARAGWSEQKIKVYHGLAKDSKMLSVYVKMEASELVDDVLALAGKKVLKRENTKEFVICPRCDEENTVDKKICSKCGMILDLEEATKMNEDNQKLQQERDSEIKTMQEQLKSIQEQFLKLAKEKTTIKRLKSKYKKE